MNEVRGSYLPAMTSLARIVLGTATSRPSSPAWTDDRGTLTRSALGRAVITAARRLPPGPVVIHSADQREVAVRSLAGLIARRPVRVVPHSAGAAALRAAHDADPTRGVAFFTSGTTGTPKLHRTRPGIRAALQLISSLGVLPLPRHPVVASFSPVDHGHGWSAMLMTLLVGGHFLCGTGVAARPPCRRIDLLTGVPLSLREYAASPPSSEIGLVLSGSDRLTDADDLERRLGAPVYDAYGSTETGTVCVASPDERRRFAGAVGRPLAGVRIRELDGVLEIRSPMLGRGTFRGDRGRIRDGIVIVEGRADGRRVSGGVTTDPQAVATWLGALPGVVDVELSERSDPRFGSRTVFTVTSTTPLDPHRLRARIAHEFGAAAAPVDLIVRRLTSGRDEKDET